MNRIILAAQLLGALVFCLAATFITDPSQGQVKRVIKGSSGDEAGTLKGHVKWGDIVLKAHSIRPEAGKAIRESAAPAEARPFAIQVDLDWAANFSGRGPVPNALNRAMRGDQSAKSGEIALGGRTIPFKNALLTEIGFPALDGASKEPAYITVKMSGEAMPPAEGAAPARLSRTGSSSSAPAGAQKTWLPSNFRMFIGGLETARVKRLSPLLLKLKSGEGSSRRRGETSLGDFVLPEADFKAANLAKWTGPEFDASKNEIRPRSGRIVYADASGRVLAVLKFRLLGLGKVKSLPVGDVQVGLRLGDLELSGK